MSRSLENRGNTAGVEGASPLLSSCSGPEDTAGLPSLSPGVCVTGGPFPVLQGGSPWRAEGAWEALQGHQGPQVSLGWGDYGPETSGTWVGSTQQWCLCACHIFTCLSLAAHLSLPSSHTSAHSLPVLCRCACLCHIHLPLVT